MVLTVVAGVCWEDRLLCGLWDFSLVQGLVRRGVSWSWVVNNGLIGRGENEIRRESL